MALVSWEGKKSLQAKAKDTRGRSQEEAESKGNIWYNTESLHDLAPSLAKNWRFNISFDAVCAAL